MIILASDNIDILSTWGAALHDLKPVAVVTSLEDLSCKLSAAPAACVVLDRELAPQELIPSIREIRSSYLQARVVLLTDSKHPLSDQENLALLRTGIRGFCNTNMNGAMIRKVMSAITQGQLWVGRSLLPKLLEEFSKQAKGAIEVAPLAVTSSIPEAPPATSPDDHLSALTPREREVATMVGQGECNKHIARHLKITERTVKAHLTTIFRKLNIHDRVHLALLTSRQQS